MNVWSVHDRADTGRGVQRNKESVSEAALLPLQLLGILS